MLDCWYCVRNEFLKEAHKPRNKEEKAGELLAIKSKNTRCPPHCNNVWVFKFTAMRIKRRTAQNKDWPLCAKQCGQR